MSAEPEDISKRSFDDAEIEKLLGQRELLDAAELIAQMGHCRWDYNNNQLLSCSQGYARIFNMSIAEIIEAQSDWDRSLAMIHTDDLDSYLAAYHSQQETGNYTVEYRFLRNDGEWRWLREVGLLKFDENRDVVDAFGILQDITDRVIRERELQDGQELAQQVEAITDIGHFINDEVNDLFLYISPGYARIHGLTVDEFMRFVESQKDNLAAVHSEDRERLRAEIIEYMEQGHDDFVSEYRIVQPDGKVAWIRELSRARRKKDGRVTETLGVLQGITDKKNFEQDLQQAKDSLEATVTQRTRELADTVTRLQQEIKERELVSSELENKNAELERFAYTASHDLKSPLVTIKGFLGLLGKDIAAMDMARVAQDIAKLNHAADTMARLLDDLLELSRIGRVAGELVVCEPTEIARQAARMVESKVLDLGIDIQIEDMPRTRGDNTRLVEVYQNLIENAIKFMGEQVSPRIDIGASEQAEGVVYFVRDNGIGIDPEYHELIFGLFERLDIDIDGTGVGLALVKRIIEVHGGKIWVESAGLGHGCSTNFTLPPAATS